MLSHKSILILLIILCSLLCSCSGERDKAREIDRLLRAYSENGQFSGVVLVAEKNNILYHRAFCVADREWGIPVTGDTRFRIASLSKPFTAVLILQLYEEGKIGLDDVITDFIPDFRNKWGDSITIHQLLTHTSGILSSLPPDEENVQEKLYHNLREMVSYVESNDPSFRPGKGFMYSNFGYSILAYIVEKISGMSYDSALQERICKPAGMSATCQAHGNHIEKKLAKGYEYKLLSGFENASAFDDSYAVGSGGLISNAEDLFLFNRALHTGKLLRQETLKKLFEPYSTGDYGYGWFIKMIPGLTGKDTLLVAEHSGSINGFGSYMAYVTSDSTLVVVLKNQRSDTYIDPAYAPEIGRQVLEILHGSEIKPPKPSIALRLGYVIGTAGIDAALNEFNRILKDEPDHYNMAESELNKLGIELLLRFKMKDPALKIFELNMMCFPKSYNTYDSYAYALHEKGDYKNSIRFYREGLDILKRYPLENNSESTRKDSAKAVAFITEMERAQTGQERR